MATRQALTPPPGEPLSLPAYARRVLVAAGIITAIGIVLMILWFAVDVLLLIFAGILFANFFRRLAQHLSDATRIPVRLAVGVVFLAFVGLLVGAGWLFAPEVARQFNELTETLPEAVRQVGLWIGQYEWGERLLDEIPGAGDLTGNAETIATQALGIFSTTLGALIAFLIVLFTSIYIALEPRLYVNGLIRLVSIRKRPRARQVLNELGDTLWWWLLGRLASMTAVGVLAALGLWWLGVPLALLLGLIVGLFDFIPNLGPWLAAIPGVLLALMISPTTAFYVVILYFVVQQIESYIITPIIERKTVHLPPALTISVQVVLGVMIGLVGVTFASPLTATGMVLAKMLYVEDVLGDRGDSEDQASDEDHQPAPAPDAPKAEEARPRRQAGD